MMAGRDADLAEIRSAYASEMAAASGSADPRLEQAFAEVPREDFVGPGPWMIMGLTAALAGERYVRTLDADPAHLYRNALVALDAEKGINNGEPSLHAAWMGALSPKPGEVVSHIGAGTGYYSAILSRLVMPDGNVHAFEIEPKLARKARRNLLPYPGVTAVTGDAVTLPLPASDIIYVNAGVVAPPAGWLRALKPGGRLIFPWRPSEEVALSVLVTRRKAGYALEPLMPSWFIPCIGAGHAGAKAKLPNPAEARRTRSIWLAAERQPDETATAIIGDVWFSSEPVSK
ncbi:MAG: SAM-dependent methyltransferase [Hyphomicrobiales bacterium]|nr:SAM-dependent methyltransferase [Hyphomicrobiales bacterium]